MKRKILVFSDTHFHFWRQFATLARGLNSRFKEQLDVFDQIAEIAKECDFALFGGDLFHLVGKVETVVFNLVKDKIDSFPIPIHSVIGNHDLYFRESPEAYHSSFYTIQALHPLSEETVIHGLKVFPIHYTDVPIIKSNVDIILAHSEIKDVYYGKVKYEEGQDWKELEKQTQVLAMGHIHQPQELSDKSFLIGNPMQLTFGDEGQRGVWILEFEDKKFLKRTFIPLKFTEFKTVVSLKDSSTEEGYIREEENKDTQIIERLQGNTIKEWIIEYSDLKSAPGEVKAYGLELNSLLPEENTLVPKSWCLDTVKIANFQCLSNVEYKVSNGITAVTGEGDEFNSNGCGKSALFEAVMWGLFGETTKGMLSDDVVNRKIGEDCAVELTLVKGEDTLKVKRYRKHSEHSNALKIEFNNILKYEVREKQKLLEQELGFSKELFLNTAYFSQEKIKMLSEMTDTERQNFLTTLLGLDTIGQLLSKARADYKEIETALSMYTSDLKFNTEGLNRISQEKSEYLEKTLTTKKDILEENAANESKIKAEEEALKEVLVNIKATQEAIKTHTDNFLQVSKNSNIDTFQKEIDSIRKEYHTLNSYLYNIDSTLKILFTKKTKVMLSKSGETCEYCGGLISEDHKQGYIDNILSEISKLEKKKLVLNDEQAEQKNKINALEAEIAKLKKKTEDNQVEARIFISQLTTEENRLQNLRMKVSSTISDLRMRIERNNSTLTGIEEKTKLLTKNEEQAITKVHSLTKVIEEYKAKSEIVSFWVDGFGKNGIPSLLLDRFCNLFNTKIDRFLNVISDSKMKVYLTPKKKMASGEYKDKIDIIINKGKYECSYESLSGGERKRVDIALLLTLDDVVRKTYNLSNRLLGILILDEVFDFLDSDGEQCVAEVIQELGKDNAVYCISHTSNLINYFPNRWVVRKKDDTSILECK